MVFYIYDQFFLQIVTSKVVKITKNGMSNSKGIILNDLQKKVKNTDFLYQNCIILQEACNVCM